MPSTERHYISPEWLEQLAAKDSEESKQDIAMKIAQKINQALSAISDRIDEMNVPNATIEGNAEPLVVEGKQGLFHLTWTRVINVSGYIVGMFTDSAGSTQIGSWTLMGASTVQFQVPVGNVSITRYFQVTPFLQRASGGLKLGRPTSIVAGTSAAYGAGESAPAAPTYSPSRYTEAGGLRHGSEVL